MKMRVVLLCVYLAVHCVHSSHQDVETPIPNVLVARVPKDDDRPHPVHLECEADRDPGDPVFWRRDDEATELRGNRVTVHHLEWEGGNYSCHGEDGQYINHTLVLVQRDFPPAILEKVHKDPGNRTEYIRCSAANYNGTFHCSWRKTAYRSQADVLLVKSERVAGDNISCQLDNERSLVTCQDLDSCSYSEEKTPITLTLYIRSDFRFEDYTTLFYLWQIAKPEPVPVKSASLGIMGKDVFHWECPPSWEPCSFFSLHYQVNEVPYNENCDLRQHALSAKTTTETSYTIVTKKRKYKFCLRAQDLNTGGPYSDWTHYMVKKRRT